MRILKLCALLVIGLLMMAATFNPADYPGIYRSGATPGATPTAQSGVIWGGPNVSNLGTCEFYNSGAATEYFAVYNSATVAGQSMSNIICATACGAATFCSCSGPNPTGPITNGALVAGTGLSWGHSVAFPGPTASPAANAWALCTYNVR